MAMKGFVYRILHPELLTFTDWVLIVCASVWILCFITLLILVTNHIFNRFDKEAGEWGSYLPWWGTPPSD